MIDHGVTAGERLCNLINHKILKGDAWSSLELLLDPTGRSEQLVQFFRQVSAVTLTGRIVMAGSSYAATTPMYDPQFKTLLQEHLRNTVGIPYRHLDELYRFAERAIQAAIENAPQSIVKSMRAWAEIRHDWCYMCGCTLDFEKPDPIRGYTLEHIWPHSYGGDNIKDNFLPACAACNSRKKADFATWAMPAIQSLMLGITPKETRLDEIHGSFKFSLHYKAAQDWAIRRRKSLKDAFLAIGPWTSVRLLDVDDVADFFNVANHKAQ